MQKKFLIFVFAILFIGACIYLIIKDKSDNESFTEMCLKEKEKSSVCTQILVEKGIFDSSACLNIEDGKMKDACYSYAARNKGDDSLCQKIKDGEWLSYCKTIVKKDSSQCDSLMSTGIMGDYWVNNCYEELAKTTNNLLLCEKFNATYRYVDCYQAVASYNNDIKICDKLKNKDQVKQCRMQFSNYKEGY